jgi:hypothetical protein
MEFTKCQYEGDMVNERMEGRGTYTFDNGTEYRGEMLDGMFHGRGTLHFPNGSQIQGVWDMGKQVEKKFRFSDGLGYDENVNRWPYCRSKEEITDTNAKEDRRFYHEVVLSEKAAQGSLPEDKIQSEKFSSLSGAGIKPAFPHGRQSEHLPPHVLEQRK